MDLEKIFNDLESNQNQESEEAKMTLIELFTQNKEQYLVHGMMEYYLKTASVRIVEVLVKVQSPHDGFIFDRLTDWLKISSHRTHALNLFCFIVRKHPTWLFKVEKHRFIKDMLNWLKQLEIEKEIVPLMSALLAIITLLPIIPNLVPNFLNDLFAVFAHLATWNNQNPNRLSEDKLVHLQLGLQMLFYRLYGMFPCNFMLFLTEFTRREKGAIFHHTIKPLLETVRLHPLLITATAESEVNCERWKEIQPHDVVVECMRLALPFNCHNVTPKIIQCQQKQSQYHQTWQDSVMATTTNGIVTTTTITVAPSKCSSLTTSNHQEQQRQNYEYKGLHQSQISDSHSNSSSMLWSPYHEIVNMNHVPLTPTQAPYLMPASSTNLVNRTNFGITGCSPPEAAVEATPETTPLKYNSELKRSSMVNTTTNISNPLAVRAIFASSQPSSPMKTNFDNAHQRQHQQQQQQHYCYSYFNFPDITGAPSVRASTSNTVSDVATTYVEQEFNTKIITRVTTTADRRIKQMLQDRKQSQSPFQTIEAQANKTSNKTASTTTISPEICFTPDVDTVPYNLLLNTTATPTPTPQTLSTQLSNEKQKQSVLIKVCDKCNETEETICSEGGLQTPTSRSVQLLAKRIKRRNRMTSYCHNENSYEKNIDGDSDEGDRRNGWINSNAVEKSSCCDSGNNNNDMINHNKKPTVIDKCVQTIESVPALNHELLLLQMLLEGKNCNTVDADDSNNSLLMKCSSSTYQQTPNEILEQFITHGLKNVSCGGGGYDQEQFQLLCLQLQYERYRREIHAERNRRLMGRSRDKRSLEMERDRLKEQLIDFEAKNHKLNIQLDNTIKNGNERERQYQKDLEILKINYQNELDKNRCLQQEKELLENNLKIESTQRKEIHNELDLLYNQVFNLTTELQSAQEQAIMGAQCKQELIRLEADFILMGEMQTKCRERLMDIENFKARDEELQILQDAYKIELRDLRHNFDEKSAQLESVRHKLQELQGQLANYEKIMIEQKRLFRAVKDEYEEKFKALNKKYEIQKTIIAQMEEKFMMSQQKPTALYNISNTCCSPDTDKTDIASSVEHNSPLSTSLASSESLSTSLKSSELRNLQQLVEPVSIISEVSALAAEATSSSNSSNRIGALGMTTAAVNIENDHEITLLDIATSANTASNILQKTRDSSKANLSEDGNIADPSNENNTASVISISSLTAGTSNLTHIQSHAHKQHSRSGTNFNNMKKGKNSSGSDKCQQLHK